MPFFLGGGRDVFSTLMFKGRDLWGLALWKQFSSSSVHPQWRSLRRDFVQGEPKLSIGDPSISLSFCIGSDLNSINRGTEAEEQILKRLRNAEAEMEQGTSSGIFDHILYNDELEECYENLKVNSVTWHRTHAQFDFKCVFYVMIMVFHLLQKLLGLDGISYNVIPGPQRINLPQDHSVSKIDNKIIINYGTPELEKASKNLWVLIYYAISNLSA